MSETQYSVMAGGFEAKCEALEKVYRVLDVAEVVEREGNLGKQRNGNNYFRGVKLDDGKGAALSLVPIVSWS